MDLYRQDICLENERYRLRNLKEEDADDLTGVYGDLSNLPYFNSDNCHGDIFYYPTKERMQEAMRFWFYSREMKYFLRLSIEDLKTGQVIGTTEIFRREAKDFFTDICLLRLDVCGNYECVEPLRAILGLIVPHAKEWLGVKRVATKAPAYAIERIKALTESGFSKTFEKLIGDDGTVYGDYYID